MDEIDNERYCDLITEAMEILSQYPPETIDKYLAKVQHYCQYHRSKIAEIYMPILRRNRSIPRSHRDT